MILRWEQMGRRARLNALRRMKADGVDWFDGMCRVRYDSEREAVAFRRNFAEVDYTYWSQVIPLDPDGLALEIGMEPATLLRVIDSELWEVVAEEIVSDVPRILAEAEAVWVKVEHDL